MIEQASASSRADLMSDPFIVRAALAQKDHVAADLLRAVHAALTQASTADLFASDMLSLTAMILEYQPDLVLELGRGWGTSTAAFSITEIHTVSICRSSYWHERTCDILKGVAPRNWGAHVTPIIGEIGDQDYRFLLKDAQRVFLFWDAHGYDVADIVLGEILPILAGREVLVACHDLRDSRYFPNDVPYNTHSLWRKQEDDLRFVRLGNVHSNFEQIVSIVDFTSRNEIKLMSPSHQLTLDVRTRELWPDRWWPVVLWHYFTLPNDRQLTFPKLEAKVIK